MTTTLSITTAAPADPATVTEYGDALPELVRALAHITRHREALDYPADADRLIRNVARAASMLPQLLDQVARWLADEDAAGQVEMAAGSRYPSSSLAAVVARMHLDAAQAAAGRLQEALDAAASVTCDMGGTGDGGEDGAGDGRA